MDAGVCARPGCGNPLLPGRKLKDVCSYACRGQIRVEAIKSPTGLKCSKNTKQNKALQTLKRRSVAGFSFTQINACTYRLDRPSKLGVGWLIEVAHLASKHELWVARIGHRASEPLTFNEAKQAAAAMLRERGRAELRDRKGDLNKIVAAEIDRLGLAEARKQWPGDLLGGSCRGALIWIDREKRNATLNAEVCFTPRKTLSGGEYELTYDADGNVGLPACLDRRKPKLSGA